MSTDHGWLAQELEQQQAEPQNMFQDCRLMSYIPLTSVQIHTVHASRTNLYEDLRFIAIQDLTSCHSELL